jgi:hypothetical protein
VCLREHSNAGTVRYLNSNFEIKKGTLGIGTELRSHLNARKEPFQKL